MLPSPTRFESAESPPMSRILLFLSVWSLLLPTLVASHGADATYDVRDIGTLGGANSRAYAINEQGWVVGEAETKEGNLHAFLWTPEDGMRDLGTHGGELSRAYAINDRGQVAGEAEDSEERLRPFRWSVGQGLEELPLPDGFREGFVYGLNNFGVLVGGGEGEEGTRALAWTVDGVSVPEALRGHGASLARAVNDMGEIAGQVEPKPEDDYISRAFIINADGAISINTSESSDWSSAALALSADGTAVGYAERKNATHAVRFSKAATAEDMDTLANVYSVAHAMNKDGVAVGLFVSSHEDDDRAFVAREGGMADLNELVETDKPWLIVEARGINSKGAIVGYALLGEQERAVLLEPRAESPMKRPSITITGPRADARFSEGDPIKIEAQVEAPDQQVRRVTFYSGGVALGSATNAPYQMVWEKAPAGTHHLVATVVNSEGRVRRSARVPVRVRIRGKKDPAVVLLEPDDGTALALGDTLEISAEVVSSENGPFPVALNLDGLQAAATNGLALGYAWRATETGLHVWVATVTDSAGFITTSAPARVHVTVPDEL